MPTAQNRGAAQFGITPQNYASYFTPVVPPMPGGDDPFGASGTTEFQIQDLLNQRKADAYNQLSNFDPENQESVKGLSRLAAMGQVPSGTANALLRESRYYNPIAKSTKNSPYSDEGTAFLNELHSQDWSDPRNAQKAVPDLIKHYPTAVSDPRVATSLQQLQQHLLNYKAPKQIDEMDWKQTIPPRFANRAGYAIQNLAKFSTALGQEPDAQTAILNRNNVASQIKALRSYGLSDDQLGEELANAGLDPEAWMGAQPPATYNPTDAEKLTAIKTHNLVDAKGNPDYHAAYYVAQGLQPPESQQVPRGTNTPVPQGPTAPPVQQPVQVNTQEQYDALPSGSVYVDSHGKSARKK